MEHCSYSLKYSLIRMPLRGHLTVIDKLLDAGILMPEDRRELLMNHALLAATVEFFSCIRLWPKTHAGARIYH